MKKHICLLFLCWMGITGVRAQDAKRDSMIAASATSQPDTLVQQVDSLFSAVRDTVSLEKKGFFKAVFFPGPRPPFDPEVAWKRSILIPGWGQLYNRDYWKLPFVYGGYVGVGIVIWYNNNQYQDFRQAFIDRNDEDPENDFILYPETVPSDGIKRARDNARSARDLSILAVAGMHLLQTIEAYVDAHLRGFDVSDDLTFELHPDVGIGSPLGWESWQPGVQMTLRLGE